MANHDGSYVFDPGDRIAVMGRNAVVKDVDAFGTVTVAYRDTWYWRVLWALQDDWWLTRRRWARAFRRISTLFIQHGPRE